MSQSSAIIDRNVLRDRRDRVAERAPSHEFLLARVADDFVERLSVVRRQFPRVLNLGAHHGLIGRRLRALPGVEIVMDMDSSPRMVNKCTGPRIVADEECLPFATGSLDLVVSGLSLQFVNDLPGVLVQIRRALKPDGLMLATMLGGETLCEMRAAFLAAETEIEGGASPRVLPFADVRDAGALLQRAGFALPVADSDKVTVSYATPLDLFREIKGMGASNCLLARRRAPMRRATLSRAAHIYAERFSADGGRVLATFELVTLTGWAPHESQQKPLAPGSGQIGLADVLGTKRGR